MLGLNLWLNLGLNLLNDFLWTGVLLNDVPLSNLFDLLFLIFLRGRLLLF